MAGWCYLPRFIDKIRLHLAGRLPADYQPNFCVKGFDAAWLEAAGVAAGQMIDVVRQSLTDGQVCDWVRVNVKGSAADRTAFREKMLQHGRDAAQTELRALLQKRKTDAGMGHRDDIQCFVDFIDADEGRL